MAFFSYAAELEAGKIYKQFVRKANRHQQSDWELYSEFHPND